MQLCDYITVGGNAPFACLSLWVLVARWVLVTVGVSLTHGSVLYRALHWVDIQMLCVPVDEEIPEVSDNVVKAITGESWMVSHRIPLGLNQTCLFKSWVVFRGLQCVAFFVCFLTFIEPGEAH